MKANLCKRVVGGGGGLSLPEDIIFEVLIRLPAKALRRFRCVCKTWRAVISDPAFVAAQRSRAGPLIVAMFGGLAQADPPQELRLLDKHGNIVRAFDLTGGTASLARTTTTRLDRIFIFVDRALLGAMIIDPAAASGRGFAIVGTNGPPPPWRAPTSTTTTTAVSSDYSFGRAAASGDYKVLRLHVTSSLIGHDRLSLSRRQWCEVATIMDGGGGAEQPTWRRRPWGPFYDTRFSREHKATVNGVLYFMPHETFLLTSQGSYCIVFGRDRIAAFDLESEEWKPGTIQCLPLECKEEDEWRVSVSLAKLKETLCVVHNDSFHGCYVYIWLLMDPNKSIWDKKYRIQMPERSLLKFMEPLDILDDGTMLLLLKVSRKAENGQSYRRYILQLYNFGNKGFYRYRLCGDARGVQW